MCSHTEQFSLMCLLQHIFLKTDACVEIHILYKYSIVFKACCVNHSALPELIATLSFKTTKYCSSWKDLNADLEKIILKESK